MVVLKPFDVVLAVMASLQETPNWTNTDMAQALGIDATQVFRASRRASSTGFLRLVREGRNVSHHVHRAALLEFLLHGIKYTFVPSIGRLTRGIPTAHAAPVLAGHFRETDGHAPVWPHPEGSTQGETFEPLHRCVPGAAMRVPRFYEIMALVDAIRGGRARDRSIAAELLTVHLRAA